MKEFWLTCVFNYFFGVGELIWHSDWALIVAFHIFDQLFNVDISGGQV